MKKITSVLQEILEKVEPPKKELNMIESHLKKFLNRINKKIKTSKIKAEIFVGGSFAKKTVIKKDYYDVDVFLRFDKKYENNQISNLTGKLLKSFKNVTLVHGSRDYFRIKANDSFFIELIPVMKVKKPEESKNITDLSYSHVNYIKRKVKAKKVLNDIKIAKAFCYANHCYGAESYIRGFSGYGLELLVYYYGGFMEFIKAVIKIKEKLIIDIEKHYKNKQIVLMDINSSKLQSPIILIDPTYKQRNALAALSWETLERFQEKCKEFLKNPSAKLFEIEQVNLKEIEKNAKKKNFEFILLEAHTNKQEGDVAGSKLLKFYNHLNEEISRYFEIKNKGFNYNGKQTARYFFVVKSRKEVLIEGPEIKHEKNRQAFKKKHKNYFTKKGGIYSKYVVKFSVKEFIKKWQKKNKKRTREMYVKNLKIK